MIGDGGPAFPTTYNVAMSAGMSLRDYFAANAPIPDEILGDALDTTPNRGAARAVLAEWCFQYADAMLQAREKAGQS